jgi:hypothetical protein
MTARIHESPNFMSDPAGAAEIIGRLCAPKRSDRYATLAEALDDLASYESRSANTGFYRKTNPIVEYAINRIFLKGSLSAPHLFYRCGREHSANCIRSDARIC